MKVELIEHMGSDLSVVNAARVSFAKASDWDYEEVDSSMMTHFDGTPVKETVAKLKAKDAKLINYLAREKHILPFRHPTISLRCKAPIFLARQLGKHQVGLTWSEESRRYIDSEPEFFWPDKWRKRAENVKQGSADEEVEYESLWQFGGISDDVNAHIEDAVALYNNMLEHKVAPELARMILPQNMYVNWVWTGSLLAFYQTYKLRSEVHAQMEAQHFANQLEAVVAPLYPASWSALKQYA